MLSLLAVLPLAAQRRATVSGHLTDALTGETLLGAGVLVEDGARRQPVGAVTNEFGYYSLTLPEEMKADLMSVSADDVLRVAQERFDPARFGTLVYGNGNERR